MYKIKQLPEDFIVKEVSNIVIIGEGDYNYFLLKKKNYTTFRALEKIANALHIPLKHIGFAGNKDKRAITEQVVSVKGINREIKLKDIQLKFLGKGDKPVSLGDLEGNEFIITVRNLTQKEIERFQKKIKQIAIPNYFGEQRFSKNNELIGRCIVKKDFKKAIELILKSNSDYNNEIKEHLLKNENDFIGALRKIPKKLLKLYIHSYQSFLWNLTVKEFIERKGLKKISIPIIGFGTEIKDKEINEIISKIMKKENIDYRDFIIRELPELSVEGKEREIIVKPNNFKVDSIGKDEPNKGKNKVVLSFRLPKACYATVVVEWLFSA